MKKPRGSLEERWGRMVEMPDDPEKCWRWIGAIDPQTGYGRIGRGARKDGIVGAHRVSFDIFHEFMPDGHEVCHRCNNRWCVNPGHLYAGTRKDNVRDAINAGTMSGPRKPVCGEGHHNAKLTVAAVDMIRQKFCGRRGDLVSLAREFGVHPITIRRVVDRETWNSKNGF